jgi:predicted alpha/beta superfamily hydrolase
MLSRVSKKYSLFFFLGFYAPFALGQLPVSGLTSKQSPFQIGVKAEITSQILSEQRALNIYLPSDYTSSDTMQYNVIYLLDGGADEDFIHIAGLVQFCTFPWIQYLPPTIVVGIGNVDRQRDFTFPTHVKEDLERWPASGHSDRFIRFIEEELQPYIESNYRISSTKTLIGQSLGGLLATEVLLTRPHLFDHYVIVSPSLWWNDASMLRAPPSVFDEKYPTQANIYIGVGKEGLAPTEKPHVMEEEAEKLAALLKSTGNPNVNVIFDFLPDENHATILHQAAYNAFRWLYDHADQ